MKFCGFKAESKKKETALDAVPLPLHSGQFRRKKFNFNIHIHFNAKKYKIKSVIKICICALRYHCHYFD